MSRIVAALFLCLAFAPLAHAQSLDCASATGLMQRVCESPDLVALEEERRNLIGELQFIDPAHPAIQAEGAFLASQEACADAACLSAGYNAHNEELSAALNAARPPAVELVPEPEAPPPAANTPARDEGRSASLDDAPTMQPGDYLTSIITLIVTVLIALWLLNAAARARRADRGE